MRVVQGGIVIGHLTEVERCGGRTRGVWRGLRPPPSPTAQTHPLTLESADGLEREDAWICEVSSGVDGSTLVELGSERDAPPWRGPCDAPRGARPARRRSSVLVVDDDVETLDAVADALAGLGHEVTRASSGRDALARALAAPPDVAIVDLMMPEVSGADVCAAFRREPRLAGARLLVLSGAEDTRLVAAECDADGAITKPFPLPLLVHEVERLLGR